MVRKAGGVSYSLSCISLCINKRRLAHALVHCSFSGSASQGHQMTRLSPVLRVIKCLHVTRHLCRLHPSSFFCFTQAAGGFGLNSDSQFSSTEGQTVTVETGVGFWGPSWLWMRPQFGPEVP